MDQVPDIPPLETPNLDGEPSYRLVIHSRNANVDKNNDIEFDFDVYISGGGNVGVAKLFGFVPDFLIEKEEFPEKLVDGHAVDNGRRVRVIRRWPGRGQIFKNEGTIELTPTPEEDVGLYNLNIPIPPYIFKRVKDPVVKYHIMNEGEVSRVGGGDNLPRESGYTYPPLNFRFKIAKDAPSGDHQIHLNLSYRNASGIPKWYTDKTAITIHVKHWYDDERYRMAILLPAAYVLVQIILILWKMLDP